MVCVDGSSFLFGGISRFRVKSWGGVNAEKALPKPKTAHGPFQKEETFYRVELQGSLDDKKPGEFFLVLIDAWSW